MKKAELVAKAIEVLENDGSIFCRCIDELDCWNGFADGWRCYPMYELDDLFHGCKVSEFLEKIDTANFDLRDDYFQDTIYGLRSVADVYDAYIDETDAGEVLDNLLENYSNLDIYYIDEDLDEVLQKIVDEEFDDAEEK